jgi:hypothetical protein
MTQPANRPSTWSDVHASRTRVTEVDRDAVPARPGIMIVYRERHAAWIAKSADLRATFNALFATQGPAGISIIRRNIAASLGISSVVAIGSGRYRPTAEDHARITRRLRESDIAWVECASESDTIALEARLVLAPESERAAPPDEPAGGVGGASLSAHAARADGMPQA